VLIVGRGQGGHRGARATCSAWGAGKMLIVESGQGVRRVPVHRVPQRDDPRATLRQYPEDVKVFSFKMLLSGLLTHAPMRLGGKR